MRRVLNVHVVIQMDRTKAGAEDDVAWATNMCDTINTVLINHLGNSSFQPQILTEAIDKADVYELEKEV